MRAVRWSAPRTSTSQSPRYSSRPTPLTRASSTNAMRSHRASIPRRAAIRAATPPSTRSVPDDAARARLIDALRTPRGSDRVIAGVASGWADRWGVEPTVVRAAVGLLTLAGGLGAVLYGLAAVLSTEALPEPPPRAVGPDRWRRELAVGCATAAILLVARAIGLWPGDGVMVPA